MPSNSQQTFRVDGISCANCAKTFENNLNDIKGVNHAEVNFAASKINVDGSVSISEIEKAGSFENIKVVQKNNEQTKEPFWIRYDRLLLASLLILFGFVASFTFGSSHYLPDVLYGMASLIGGLTLFKAGLINLTKLRFDMKTLMTIAVIGAIIIGEWREAAVVVILFAISEALESYSMDKARSSIRSLMKISPKQALIRRNGIEQNLHIEDIAVGDSMLVKPGDRIAMDGKITHGFSSINQAPITGESIPVEKSLNDEVFAGTINQDGYLEIEVTKKSEDTTIAKIIHLVEEAQTERAPSQAFIDNFAAYYTPVIIAISVIVAVLPPLFGGAWSTWVYQGLAVLVVGCPCALVVSTPVAIVTAIGNAARNGVLIKGGIYLEQIGALHSIAFDKTGTLTEGTPKVTDVYFYTDERKKALGYLKALEEKSSHPLAIAIIDYINNEPVDVTPTEVQQFTTVQGKGIKGEINGKTIFVGSAELFSNVIPEEVKTYQESGKTVMLCGTDEEILMAVALRDEPRKESKNVIKQLHNLGISHTYMLTGDHAKAAAALKQDLELTDVKAGLLPEDKLEFIKKYEGNIAMIGDGINDTPALAASSVGIAMGSAGTDSALETADVALMADDLDKLPFTIKLSRRALFIIKQNITFAIGIKALALLLVIPGWLTLWIAIFADMGATLLVTLNALRLLKIR
ncbi:heavy metal translocating P-type ATPase [Virgibacillus doumboii]|uniref:heavy metal translocating P-type ATPase n=1 Tax=Virgibacillus doumboii TaxID=2697503 RepID=UPI0013DF951C|nr:heavy metal translocating P-type ATPase [Virgibacillus doumboii]